MKIKYLIRIEKTIHDNNTEMGHLADLKRPGRLHRAVDASVNGFTLFQSSAARFDNKDIAERLGKDICDAHSNWYYLGLTEV